MSYDIKFKVKAEGADVWIPVGDCDANITWNVREIITRSTGLEWRNEENNGYVADVIPFITKGLGELYTHPEKYKKYEAKNGWGTVEGTIHFFEEILKSWKELKSGWYGDPQIADIATFWIE